MKQLYVTYVENGILKKATINESRYKELSSKSSIQELVVYPSQILMEQNYSMKCSNGVCTPKRTLND